MIMEQFKLETAIRRVWYGPATIEFTSPSEDCLGKLDVKVGKPAWWYCRKPYP